MRFHGVCGRLVAHPLHGDLPLGDTLVRNPHQSSKSTGLETPDIFTHRLLMEYFATLEPIEQAGQTKAK
jgi:hypothetical protein